MRCLRHLGGKEEGPTERKVRMEPLSPLPPVPQGFVAQGRSRAAPGLAPQAAAAMAGWGSGWRRRRGGGTTPSRSKPVLPPGAGART